MAKKLAKKVVRKRKNKESFSEEPSSFVPDEKKVPLCECGDPALENNHQCYRCSHRS